MHLTENIAGTFLDLRVAVVMDFFLGLVVHLGETSAPRSLGPVMDLLHETLIAAFLVG